MTAEAAPTAPGPVQAAPAPSPAAPATPAPRRKRFARWRPSVALGSVAAGLVGSQLVALAILFAAGGDDAPDWIAALGIVIADMVLLAVVIAVARKGAPNLGPATLGIRRTKFWPAVGWMCLTYFAVTIFNVFWLLVVGTGSVPRDEDPSGGTVTLGGVILVAFGIAVVAPIVEEITFRGYLFPALTRWPGPWIGALTGGTIFGLAHCAVYPPQLLPLMAVFGIVACLLYWFTGSLLPCVALHAMNNALVTGRDLGWSWEIPVFMLGCMAVAVLLLLPFARERAPIHS
jgi:membrane protease YdiL (CAAX protease family)